MTIHVPGGGGGGGDVTSVFGRTGVVAAETGDYSAAQVTGAANKTSVTSQTFSGPIATVGTVQGNKLVASGNVVANAVSGELFIRPSGPTATSGQVGITSNGTIITPGAVELGTVIAKTTASTFTIRPNGGGSATGQLQITTAGLVTLAAAGSFVTTTSVAISTTTAISGVAFTPSATKDTEIVFNVTTAGALKITYGPTSGTEHVIMPTVAVSIGSSFTKRIPAAWKVIITKTASAISPVLIQTV